MRHCWPLRLPLFANLTYSQPCIALEKLGGQHWHKSRIMNGLWNLWLMRLCVCLSVTQGDRQLESDMKSLTEKKELCSGKVTAKTSELPWWQWVCHQIMGNGSGWTSRRRESVHLSNQEIKTKLENKSTEIPQNPCKFYYGDDNIGLFKSKNHHNNNKKNLRSNLSELVILGWSANAVCVLSKHWGGQVRKLVNSSIRGFADL